MTDKGPIHLEEDGETGDRFLVYESGKGARLDIRFEGETLWMTQEQIARLFGVTRQAVNGHIVNVYGEGELDGESTCKEILQVRLEGKREANPVRLLGHLCLLHTSLGDSSLSHLTTSGQV